MQEREFCQTSFSRWIKLWSIHVAQRQIGALFGGCMFPRLPAVLLTFGLSIRYPDPVIKVNDTVKIDLTTGKITDFIKFDTGAIAMVTGGRNMGRVGVITHRERHDGGFNIVHLKDAIDNTFATRESNVFVIGLDKPWISLPKGKGIKLTIAEERDRKRANTIAAP
jgi:small subunit ribosomal protein S4e